MDSEAKAFLSIALIIAMCAHIFVPRFLIACLVIVILSPALYSLESFIRLGLPPAKIFWLPFVFLEGSLYSLGIAVMTGLPFYLFRCWRRRNAKRNIAA
jgi:hypothetical protein